MPPDFARATDLEPDPEPEYAMLDAADPPVGDEYAGWSAAHTSLDFADDHLTQLGLTLDFGPAELAANRAGWLTEAQIARLETDLRWFYWPMILVLAIIAFGIGAGSALAGTLTAMPLVLLGAAAIPAVLLKLERGRLPDRRVQVTRLRMGRFSMVMRRWGVVGDEESFGSVRYPAEATSRCLGQSICTACYAPINPTSCITCRCAPGTGIAC